MSNVIEFLETLGRDAFLRHAGGDVLAKSMEQSQMDPALRAAVLSADQQQLEAILGAKTNVCCMIYAPEDDRDAPVEDQSASRYVSQRKTA